MHNIFKKAALNHALYKKRFSMFFDDFCKEVFKELLAAIKERTPVDYGALRLGFDDSNAKKIGNVYKFNIENTATSKGANPALYAAHIEWGYKQKPGMILKMRMESGRLRFVEFMGYSFAYGTGDPTGKAEPDEDGNYIIVTRKRDIKGKHMVKDSLYELASELPERFAKRFNAFNEASRWI
ncbi:MAG: hypothetical protein M0Q90_16380 [Bacteroidales bacterium]|nr:hypothetical protein [Bacteroidales bacterium]